jgi:CubicO group peptidase (beta-lactamase class C family)
MLARTWTDGFLVLHQNKVLTEQYFNGMQADTLHLMMSCSKSLTSTLLGIFVEAGAVDLSRRLSHYIPELEPTAMAGATLQQALDMQVGVRFSEDYDDLTADWRQLEVATGWREPPANYAGPTDMVGYMQTLTDSERGHGTQFYYQSILTDVLGVCLQRATGRSFSGLFEEHIWHPLGAEQEFVTIIDGAGNAVFEGGFNCCLRDFARFGGLIAQQGEVGGRQLVPSSWIEACRQVDQPLLDAFSTGQYGEVLPGFAYHNQWWVCEPERGVIMALGIHGQCLYIDSENEFVVAKFSSQPAQVDSGMALDQLLGIRAIADMVGR